LPISPAATGKLGGQPGELLQAGFVDGTFWPTQRPRFSYHVFILAPTAVIAVLYVCPRAGRRLARRPGKAVDSAVEELWTHRLAIMWNFPRY